MGGWHALALDAEGCVYAWGGNEYNQCAVDAAQRDVVLPTRCVPDLRVCQVAAGGMHSLALTESGQIWMWGEPWGDFSMTIDRSPRRIDTTSSFVRIVCGAFHNLALDESGQVWSWGINDFGQLGNGTTSYATAPQRITEGLEGVHIADIAAGGWHSLAISAEGEVYIWGRGEYGRLGLGDKSGSSKLRPTKIASLEGLKVVEASCGGTHSMVVTEDGRAFIWGRGGLGRLGTGDEKDRYSPVEVKLPGGPERWRAISVAAGGRHSLVLALPDNGDLEARQSGWLARRSPVGLSPQPSGVHMPLPPSAAAVARAWAAAAEPETAAEADDEGGGDDKDAADSSDGEEEPSAGKLVEAGEPVSESIEQAVDELTGLNVVEGAPGNAPHHSSEGNGGRNAVGDDDDSSVAAARREAAEEEGRREVRETQARAAGESPRLTGTSEGGDDYEEGGSDSETAENGGGRIMRMQSLAAATVHGLRDDLLGDRG